MQQEDGRQNSVSSLRLDISHSGDWSLNYTFDCQLVLLEFSFLIYLPGTYCTMDFGDAEYPMKRIPSVVITPSHQLESDRENGCTRDEVELAQYGKK